MLLYLVKNPRAQEELIVRLNEAEEALEKTRAEAGEMANELVNQYNRFQAENQQLKTQLEAAHEQAMAQIKVSVNGELFT